MPYLTRDGVMSDRFNTRWGRRKPWILFGVPLYAFAVWMLLNPEVGTSIVYLAFFFILLRLATTVLGLPYAAWGWSYLASTTRGQ